MDLRSILSTTRNRWRIILSFVLAGVAIAAVAHFVVPQRYTASTVFYVSAQTGGESPAAAYQGSLLSQQRVTSYVSLISSPRITSQIAQITGRPTDSETLGEIADDIKASSSSDSVLINVAVTADSAESASAVANIIGRVFPPLVAELERPANGANPAVAVRVVNSATPPDVPSSPGLGLTVLGGFLAGLVLGLLCASALETLDRSLRGSEALETSLQAPTLATIEYRENTGYSIALLDDKSRRNGEQYRKLRTNLRFSDIDSRLSLLAVTSSVKGEGKTTTAVNLAGALALEGSRVVIVDADLRLPSVQEFFGLDGAVGLTTVLAGECALQDALQPCGIEGLSCLTSGLLPPNPSELLASKAMADLLLELRRRFDYIVVDTTPLLAFAESALMASVADGVLFVARYGATTDASVAESRKTLSGVSANVVGGVLSMSKADPVHRDTEYYYYAARRKSEGRVAAGSHVGDTERQEDTADRRSPSPRPRS